MLTLSPCSFTRSTVKGGSWPEICGSDHSAIKSISSLRKMLAKTDTGEILLLPEFMLSSETKMEQRIWPPIYLSRLVNPHQDKLEKNKDITETFPIEKSWIGWHLRAGVSTHVGAKMLPLGRTNCDDALWAFRSAYKTTHRVLLRSSWMSRIFEVSRAICPSITRASQSSASFGNPDILILSTNVYL
ncbi:hypothetical protein Tco_1191273 [Tanacetum coccineum]